MALDYALFFWQFTGFSLRQSQGSFSAFFSHTPLSYKNVKTQAIYQEYNQINIGANTSSQGI